jgi:hypothetical protein
MTTLIFKTKFLESVTISVALNCHSFIRNSSINQSYFFNTTHADFNVLHIKLY